MTLVKQSMYVFGGQVFLRGVTVLTGIILARSLGPAGKGAYALIWLVPFMVALFGGFGLGSAHVFMLGKKRCSIDEVAGNSLVFAFISGFTLLAFFLVGFEWFAANLLENVDPKLVLLAAFTVPIFILVDYSRNLLLAAGQITQFNILGVIDELLLLVFVGGWLLIGQFGLPLVVSVKVVAVIARGALGFWYMKKQTIERARVNLALFKQSFSYGLRVYLANVMQFFNYRLDLFIISYFLGLASTGQYSVSAGLASLVWFIPQSVGVALFPRISAATTAEANRETPVICRQTVLITLVGAAVLAALGRPLIIMLFGEQFAPAFTPFLLLLPGTVFFAIPKVINSDLLGRGHPFISTFSAGISLVATILLDLLLIPRWGINGAAVASSAAYALYAVIMVISFSVVTRVPAYELLVPRISDLFAYGQLVKRTPSMLKDTLKGLRLAGIDRERD